jgi:hypothetical protein
LARALQTRRRNKKSNDTHGISYFDIERAAFTAHEATHEDLFDATLFFGN